MCPSSKQYFYWICENAKFLLPAILLQIKSGKSKFTLQGINTQNNLMAIYNAGLVNRVVFLPSMKDLLDTASMLTSLIAMQCYTPFNTFQYCLWLSPLCLLLNFELFALEAVLCLLIFMFWSCCPVNDIDLLRFLKCVEWFYTKSVTNSCAICAPVMQNSLLYYITASKRKKKRMKWSRRKMKQNKKVRNIWNNCGLLKVRKIKSTTTWLSWWDCPMCLLLFFFISIKLN